MRKMDGVVAIIFLLMAAALFGYNLTHREAGSLVEIAKDGQVVQVERLSVDQTIRLEYDDQTNLIEIEDGVVSMIDANCRDQLCVHTAPLKTVGRAIVCLPHRVSVVIKGEGDQPEMDAISE
ncbi:MAG TPA: NusG domain II-containing protein [Tissierellia bacterium]|nr:NusG domain II-containing protein [Tissierellia bacterium]